MKLVLVVVATLSVSCAVADDEFAGESIDDDSSDLSTTKDTFVIVRRDQRRCIAPLCGGYWVKDLNSTMQERYVSAFDFGGSTLSDEVQAQVTGGPDFEIVLEGRLGQKENVYNTRTLRVIAAYRGMPGMTLAATDKFYSVSPTRIACITQPCANLQTTRLNRTTGHTMATDVSVERALATMVDEGWLHDRVVAKRAVVAGRVVRKNNHVTVDARQVFIALPDQVALCPADVVESCPSGEVIAFERTTDRCTVAVGCTVPGVCAPFDPTCDAGYSLVSWQNMCPRNACEPAFLHE